MNQREASPLLLHMRYCGVLNPTGEDPLFIHQMCTNDIMWNHSSGSKSGSAPSSSAASLCSASPTKSSIRTTSRKPALQGLQWVSTLQYNRRPCIFTSAGRSSYRVMPLQTPPSCLMIECGASTISTAEPPPLKIGLTKRRLNGRKDLHPSTTTSLIAGQSANASASIFWIVSGKLMCASLVHPAKARALMEVTPLRIIAEDNAVQHENVSSPIEVMKRGIVTDVKEAHP